MSNLYQTKEDCKSFRECLLKYEVMDSDIHNLYEKDPSSKDVGRVFTGLSAKLMKSKRRVPMEKYLIFFLFATHGILFEGRQSILLNEFKDNFYHQFAAEAKLRSWAGIFPHAYIISIFACCRQLYNKETMTGIPRGDKYAELKVHVDQFKKTATQFQKILNK